MWTAYPEDDLRKYGRVAKKDQLTANELNNWNTYKDEANLIPLKFSDSNGGGNTYSSYMQCYKDVK